MKNLKVWRLMSVQDRKGDEKMIRVNGVEELHLEGKNLKEYLQEKGYRMERIAVEKNGDIVPKSSYQNIILQDGDVLEVVSFVGGG